MVVVALFVVNLFVQVLGFELWVSDHSVFFCGVNWFCQSRGLEEL